MKALTDLGINLKGKTTGNIKTTCPRCSQKRRKKNDPCLSVNIDEGIFNCHHCGYKGSVKNNKKYVIPEYVPDIFEDDSYNDAVKYLHEKRKISLETIRKFKITCEEHYFFSIGKTKKAVVFNYFKDGFLINKKYRSFDKDYSFIRGAEQILYNVDNLKDEKYLIITEGEIDCMSFYDAGFVNVVSIPTGANNNFNYLKSFYDRIKQYERVYLAFDGDEKGRSIIEEFARRVGREKCLIVDYPENTKDCNEVLVKYGKEGVKEIIENAKFYPIDGVILANDVYNDVVSIYSKGFDKGLKVEELGSEFDNLVTFKQPFLYTFTGIPSHGKSSLVNYLEVLLAVKHDWKIAVFSPEHYPLSTLIYRYIELLLGKPFFGKDRLNVKELELAMEFINEHFYFIRPTDSEFTVDKIISLTKSLIFRFGINLLTIDPYNMIEHNFSGNETQYIEKLLNRFQRFRHAHNIAMFLVAHPRKMQKDKNGLYEVPNLYDIAGSSNFFNKTDFGISVYRDMQTGVTRVYVQKCKYKSMGSPGSVELIYDLNMSRFYPVGSVNNKNLIEKEYLQQKIEYYETEDYYDTTQDDDLPF